MPQDALPESGSPLSEGAVYDERRRYHSAREAFEYAYSILEPFLHPEAGWQGRSLQHLSFGLVCENFPHLAHEEVHALLDAVSRVFAERNRADYGLTPQMNER